MTLQVSVSPAVSPGPRESFLLNLGAGSPSVLMTGPQTSWGPTLGATSLVPLPSDALYWPEGVTAADPAGSGDPGEPQGTQDWGPQDEQPQWQAWIC